MRIHYGYFVGTEKHNQNKVSMLHAFDNATRGFPLCGSNILLELKVKVKLEEISGGKLCGNCARMLK